MPRRPREGSLRECAETPSSSAARSSGSPSCEIEPDRPRSQERGRTRPNSLAAERRRLGHSNAASRRLLAASTSSSADVLTCANGADSIRLSRATGSKRRMLQSALSGAPQSWLFILGGRSKRSILVETDTNTTLRMGAGMVKMLPYVRAKDCAVRTVLCSAGALDEFDRGMQGQSLNRHRHPGP